MRKQGGFVPKYEMLADWIRERINNGSYEEGSKIESENQLITKFGVSRQTVRHAIDALCEEGLIYSVRGSGSFIKPIAQQKPKYYKIGVILTCLTDYFVPSIIGGIEDVLSTHGYEIALYVTKGRIDAERRILESIIENEGVDGLLIEATKTGRPTPNKDLFLRLRSMHIPYVFVNSYHEGIDAPYTTTDDYNAGLEATKHLIQLRHTRIGGVFCVDDYQGYLRYLGYCKALSEANLPFDDNSVLWLFERDYENMTFDAAIIGNIKKLICNCTAIVSYNDHVTVALLKQTEQMGYSVPKDLSVISFDNSMLAQYGRARFTSMNHPKDVIGAKGAEMLMQILSKSRVPESSLIHMNLIPGTTTGEYENPAHDC